MYLLRKKILLFICLVLFGQIVHSKQKVCIVIPAYNEEKRIQSMLGAYLPYFEKHNDEMETTFVIVANNCSDNTVPLCKKIQKKHPNIEILNFKQGGKGFALKEGYLHALQKQYNLIGFVDADMATLPQYFHDLIKETKGCDGAIASRYMPTSNVWPKRPFVRKLGGKLYNWILRQQFKVPFKDTQCGAKIFTYDTIRKVAPDLQENGWACDLEFLYLCQLEDKKIKEVATTWSDQPGSHLEISSKLVKEFLSSPSRIKQRHKEKALQKKREKKHLKKQQKQKVVSKNLQA